VLSAAICAALPGAHAFKPVVTGLDEEAGEWPPDHELLASLTGQAPEEVSPLRFGPAVSPHLAASLAGVTVEPAELLNAARSLPTPLVCEGVGGLLVPLTTGYSVRDFAVDLGLPVVIAARPGLGTINHTLLTLEAARAAGLRVAAVVLTPWPDSPSEMERSNRETIAALGRVAVEVLPFTSTAALREAASALPVSDWV
jgi:dethiobiotin synthetase